MRRAEDECLEAGVPAMRSISALMLLLSNRFTPTSAMIRRELSFRFADDRRYMEDHLLWLQIAFADCPVAHLDAELAFQFKSPYGEGGLASQMWQMQKGLLSNYWFFFRRGAIGLPLTLALCAWSMLKFARRILYSAIPLLRARVDSR